MLRNVLEDYLNSVKERDFDYPLTALLQAMGFFDIHLTDGGSEFGKDFIAKRKEGENIYQYAIQSKRGDINQTVFRNKILGQLLEAIVLKKLSHSQLDTSLPQKCVLVTTGELVDNAFLELREFNNQLENEYKKERVEFWGKNQLIEFSEKYGLSGVHRTTAKGLKGFAQFYLVYSKAIEKTLSDREIEEFSRLWLDESLEYRKRILRASIEAEIIASKLIENGLIYEAIIAYLSLVRIVLQTAYENSDSFITEIYNEILNEKILPLCKEFFTQFKSNWEEAEKSLLNLCFKENAMPMLQYIVWCTRVLELSSLYCFLTKNGSERSEIITFLVDFIEKEEGCGHIPSDRYAVSLVWTILALLQSKKRIAISLIKKSVIWLCDRTEKGFGLARYEVDEYEETITLLGYPFDFIEAEKNRSSYLATVLSDLAAFVGDKEFYADVINDFEACDISYTYWQFPDTKAIFTIDSNECLSYANIPHQYSIDRFDDFEYSEHIKHEPQSFQIIDKVGEESLILLSILLKDRYFPTMWKKIILDEENKEQN
jgi:hypothetical protein